MVFLALQKLFRFMRSPLLGVDLRVWNNSILFRNLSPVLICSRQFLTFSSVTFSVSGLLLWSLIHLDLVINIDLLAFFYVETPRCCEFKTAMAVPCPEGTLHSILSAPSWAFPEPTIDVSFMVEPILIAAYQLWISAVTTNLCKRNLPKNNI